MENAPARPLELDFKHLFQVLPGLYVILSPDLLVLAVSDAYLQATHATRETLVGRNIFDSFPENPVAQEAMAQATVEASMRHALVHKVPHLLPAQRYDVISKSGSFEGRYWRISSSPVLDGAGDVLYLIHEVRDVTNEILAEREKQESTERFRRIAMATSDVIWDWNLRNDTIWWNDGYTTLFGLPISEDMPIASWTQHIHPEDVRQVTDSIHHTIDNGASDWQAEYRFRCADGTYKIVHDKGNVLRDETGVPVRMVGAMLDITARWQHEQQLQESNLKFQFLAESIPQIVWSALPSGDADYINQRWYDYSGMTAQQTKELGWLPAIHPDQRQAFIDSWQNSIASGEPYYMEVLLRNIYTDHYRWHLARALPMRNAEGDIVKWFGTCTDIEDHKRAEEELVEKNLELERTNHDLDSFVYAASHDLKLPIVNMAGIFAELTRVAVFRDPEAPRMVEMFDRSLQQIHNTIQDLSDVVKVQRAKAHKLEMIDLAPLTEDVQLSLQDLLKETDARLLTDYSLVPALPFTKSSLKSILFNLISNALKYRAPNRVPEISLRTQLKGDYIELAVKDNGLGIDMNKHQSKLFQMFKRFHSHVNGSGLGLYIVNRLLTNHGGYINIESTLDEGTTFYLYFKHKKS